MVHGGPEHAKEQTGPFHESARVGILSSPTGSEMTDRQRRFLDRVEAGELLADVLDRLVSPPVVVLGIPRGGVVVAARVAARLHAPLDVVVPRKVGAPGNPELAVGAVADGVTAIDEPAIRRLGLDMAAVRAEVASQTAPSSVWRKPLRVSRSLKPEGFSRGSVDHPMPSKQLNSPS